MSECISDVDSVFQGKGGKCTIVIGGGNELFHEIQCDSPNAGHNPLATIPKSK